MIIKPPEKEQIFQLRQLWKEAFGDTDAFLDHFFRTGFAPERCRCVIVDGQLVSALYWFSCEADGQSLAYLYAVATARQYRGQGYGTKLMADTHSHLKRLGYAGAILVPGDPGLREMYRTMGYSDMTGVQRFSCKAGKPVALEKLESKEYATLRRKRLPPNGVLQEGENLRFLETMAQFYRGEDLLLCAAQDGDKLIVLELLGNQNAAPGIVASMGCVEGRFTVPGETEPFAMGIPFVPEFQRPRYFAFAFD